MRPCLREEKEKQDRVWVSEPWDRCGCGHPSESEGLLEVLSSSALCSPLPGADITQGACGKDKGPSVCVQYGVWHHPAAAARTPRLCQGQMQRVRVCGQATTRIQGAELCFSEKMMSKGHLGIPGPQANSGCMVSPWEIGDSRHTHS